MATCAENNREQVRQFRPFQIFLQHSIGFGNTVTVRWFCLSLLGFMRIWNMGNYSNCSNFICVADSFIRSRVKSYFAYENSVVRHQNRFRLQNKIHVIVDISILISSYASSYWMFLDVCSLVVSVLESPFMYRDSPSKQNGILSECYFHPC